VTLADPTEEARAEESHPLPAIALQTSVGKMVFLWSMMGLMALVFMTFARGNNRFWRDFPLVVGGCGVLFCAYAMARCSSLRFRLDETGLTYTGLFRSVDVSWSSILWVGWLMQPASAYSPTSYSFAVGVRGRRLPCCLLFWVSSRTLADLNSMTQSEVEHEIELAVTSRKVWYRPRLPDMTPVALWVVTMAVILALAFIPFAIIALTR
jgi:hypothetical protein